MIISFDGNVFVGKTTIISNLSLRFGFNKMPEYGDVLSDIFLDCDYKDVHKNNQERYLMVDKKRMNLIKEGVNLLDRSFVSMSAHIYALNKMKIMDIRDFYIARLAAHLGRKEIILPNKYIIVSCPYEVAYDRFVDGYSIKGTGQEYIKRDYFEYVNEFNFRWLESIPGLMVDSREEVSCSEIADFINEKQPDVFTENQEAVIGKIKKILIK